MLHNGGMGNQLLFESVRDRLTSVSGPDAKSWYTVLCSLHDDHKPSLRFNTRGFECMACRGKGGLKALAEKVGIEQQPQPQQRRTIAATYDYLDERGQCLFQVVLYNPKEH